MNEQQQTRLNLMKSARQILLGGMLAAAIMAVAPSAWTQQINGTPGDPSATVTIDGKQIPPPPMPFGGVIKESATDSKPYWPPRVVPPKGAPNILLIMTDDQGYGVSGTFGGVIPTPAMDRIAKAGLRYTQFHSTALCSAPRGAVITGPNHHSVGTSVNGGPPDKPFFVYYVPGGTHSPHHPTKEWIAKFKGKFDMGYEKLREQIFENQKKLGVIPPDTQLTPWPDGQDVYGGAKLPRWDSLSFVQKKLYAREAEVFAAYPAYTDYEIGRVIQEVQDEGKLDNTLIIYISGDNGTSAEGTEEGTYNTLTAYNGILKLPEALQMLHYEGWGSDTTYPHMAVQWSWAFDTSFKWTKQVASHFGGTRQGMAISGPGHISDAGGIRTQFHHMIDIVPTLLEAPGIKTPEPVHGIKQKPIEGVSMVYTFDKANADAPSKHETQYFEMVGNRAIYHDGWVAATTPHVATWLLGAKMPELGVYLCVLYKVAKNFSENNDLAAQQPDKLKEMQALFLTEAGKYNVFPLDNSGFVRLLAAKS